MFVSVKHRIIYEMEQKQSEILSPQVGISSRTTVVAYFCLFYISFLFISWLLDILLFYREEF